jgi:hypothetical protein
MPKSFRLCSTDTLHSNTCSSTRRCSQHDTAGMAHRGCQAVMLVAGASQLACCTTAVYTSSASAPAPRCENQSGCCCTLLRVPRPRYLESAGLWCVFHTLLVMNSSERLPEDTKSARPAPTMDSLP